MEIKVIHFQVVDGWIYILFDDGTMNRKYLPSANLAKWEDFELPVQADLVVPIQSKAGALKSELKEPL